MLAFLAPKRLQIVLQQQAYFQYAPATHKSAESLVAELDVIREDGIAFDREEHEQGIHSIAAPVLSSNGRVIGAISIATSTSRRTRDRLNEFRPLLLETAKSIGEEATSWQFPS